MTINKRRLVQSAPFVVSMLLIACGLGYGSQYPVSRTASLEDAMLTDMQSVKHIGRLNANALAETIGQLSIKRNVEKEVQKDVHRTLIKSGIELPKIGLFLKPLTQAQADELGVAYSTTNIEMGEVWPRYTQSQAVEMCSKLGSHLATKEELTALYQAYPNKMLKNVLDWPTMVGYWSSTNNAGPYYYYYMYLDDQFTNSNNSNNNHYASCVTHP